MGCRFLLQRIFATQRSNPGLPHCMQTLYSPNHGGNPFVFVYIYTHICVCVPLLIYLCEYMYVCFIPFSLPWLVRGREMISEKRTFFFSYSSIHQEEMDNRSIPIFSLSISPLRFFHVNRVKHYYGQNYIPQKDTLKLSPLTSQTVTLFENRVCIEVIKLKHSH